MPDLISITSGDLTARIKPAGRRTLVVTDAAGREYMTEPIRRSGPGMRRYCSPSSARLGR
jgi:hypothetical protein